MEIDYCRAGTPIPPALSRILRQQDAGLFLLKLSRRMIIKNKDFTSDMFYFI